MTTEREGLRHRRAVEQAGFARLSHLVITDPDLSDAAVRLYARLLYYARQDVQCWPGCARLARDLGKSERAIKRALGELVERGLITREQRGHGLTAMTYIEDLATVYGDEIPSSDKNGTASSDKNGTASSDKNGTQTRNRIETTNNDDDDDIIKQQTKDALVSVGVTPKTAMALAARHDLERVQAVIDHARANGDNPAGLVVWMLRNDAPIPTSNGGGPERGRDRDRRRYLEWKQGGRDE